ncbi:TRAP transporter small permease [Clostridium sp. AM58-1XD]|uniref:TRAP transporter small permease n=1 Tax=Clostridium sp. AM58-1XD TaxID=2292307 RepID=UPI000E47DD4F|nr:TRAP transporter small permease [Clostridium sp. AM58-1XD]RGZ01817.1 TRAP transporter small permease [Clostridium sp. AM58-1XD]
MKNVIDRVIKVLEVIFGFVGIVMIVVETYAVFARNVLKIPTPWTDEFLKLLFIWSIFVCSALAFYSDSLICLTLIEDSEKVKKKPAAYGTLKVIQYLSGFGVSAFMIKHLCTIVATQMRTGEATTVMKYPLYLINMGLLVGMILVCLFGIMKLIDCKKYFVKTEKV